MKEQKIKRISIPVVALCAIIIFSIVLTVSITGPSRAAAAYIYERETSSKAEALENANEFNEELCEEGIVLLKNENGALPFASGNKVSVFGKNSADLVYGGTGSGGGDSTSAKTLYDSLSAAGFTYNPALKSFYESFDSGPGRPRSPQLYGNEIVLSTGETPQSSYTDAVKNSYNNYNDAAIVVISRIGGEGFDLPQSSADDADRHYLELADRHYLELDANEKDLLRQVCGAGFGKVVVIINSANVMQLGFIEDGTYGNIDACLWMGFPGNSGVMALGRVLNGTVNPSGRTVDTWARDFKKDPAWVNFANNGYADGAIYTVNGDDQIYRFADYEEGIYVGYRYWETRYAEVINESGNAGNFDYNEEVLYSFGYGLSYTEFSYSNFAFNNKEDSFMISVEVTNTGNITGKDVVQIYMQSPYTQYDKINYIEKSAIELVGFAKTNELSRGEREKIQIEIPKESLRAYDARAAKTYIVDSGDYYFAIGKSAHDALNNICASKGFSTTVSQDANGDPALAARYSIPSLYYFDTDPLTGAKVVNRFADADDQLGGVLSRRDWDATWPAARTDAERAVTQTFINTLADVTHNNPNEYNIMPLQGVNGSLRLCDLIGLSYDDPRWDSLLDMLTVDDMQDLVSRGAFGTVMILGISKPATMDGNGPAGFTHYMFGTCFYACEVVAASTWNTELLYAYGKSLGEEALWDDKDGAGILYSGLYAPGVNIHRSPFGGRNFEYYSEDGYLSGEMAAAVIRGAQSKGLTMYVKHFALNEQETNRGKNGLVTWATEQSIREIYLKPFEKAVKDGGARGIMTSYNRIGTKWTGGDYRLLTEVLRNEWGFRGTVISEFNLQSYMDVKQMLYAGGDLSFAISGSWRCNKSDPGDVTVLRQAAKNILYTVASSNAIYIPTEEFVPDPKPSPEELLLLLADLYESIENLIMTLPGGSVGNITSALDYLAADIAEIEKLLYGTGYFEDFYNGFVKENAPLYIMTVKTAAAEISLCFENADGNLRRFTEDLYEIVNSYLIYLELLMPGEGYDMTAVKEIADTVFASVLSLIDEIYDIIGYPEPANPVGPTAPGDPTPADPTPADPAPSGNEKSGCSSTVSTAGIATVIGMMITAAALLIITAKKKKQR